MKKVIIGSIVLIAGAITGAYAGSTSTSSTVVATALKCASDSPQLKIPCQPFPECCIFDKPPE